MQYFDVSIAKVFRMSIQCHYKHTALGWGCYGGLSLEEKIITRDEVEGDNVSFESDNHHNTLIQGQYVFYYTECLMFWTCTCMFSPIFCGYMYVICFFPVKKNDQLRVYLIKITIEKSTNVKKQEV